MTIDQLIRQLTELGLPGDTLVVLAKDPEGNGFRPADELAHALYDAEERERYDVTDACDGECGDDCDNFRAPDTAVSAVVIWPGY